MLHTVIHSIISAVRRRFKYGWHTVVLRSLLLLFVLAAATFASAQEGGVKPIGLVTGDYMPAIVKPAQVKVAPDAIFDDKYFKLIQFSEIPGESERKAWETAGLHLVDYLPENTYYAVIDQRFDLTKLSGLVTTIVDVPDVCRVEPRLAEMRLAPLPEAGGAEEQLVVSYYATLDAQEVIAALEARGAKIIAHRDYSRQLDIVIDPAHREEIIGLPFIQFVGPEPEEPVLEGQDYRNASGRSNYLNTGYNGITYNGTGVVIGVGEGGTVDNLMDVKGRLTEMGTGDPSSHKITVMRNAGGAGNLDPTDRNNAWGAIFLSLNADAYGNFDYSGLYSSHNLRYTNHSFGYSISGGYDSSARDHDMRIASPPNHLVIYSAGNSGHEQGYAPYNFAGCPANPADCWANITGQMKQNKNMFAIGNLEASDALVYHSSRGPMYDGRIIPQLAIAGTEGTSYAAPKITGELAMLVQVYKTLNGGTEPPSTLLRVVMMNTADDLGNAGPDYKHGYGQPNMRRAYNVINNARFFSDSISNGNTNQHTLSVPANTTQVRVMLIWADVAASVGANPAIVNNLNLVLRDPSATNSYNPWVLDPTADPTNLDSPATRQVDNLNTYEQVTVDNPTAGDWTIEVGGFNVPQGPQAYYITYEFLGDELHMGFPLLNHRFVPGDTYHLKWDSYGGTGTFDLDYRLDGGSWVNIVTGHDAASRTYAWVAPAVAGIHTIEFRVQRGTLTAASDVNYIGDVPQRLALDWACADGVRLTWDAVAGATGYKVYRLGTQYMEEVTTNITFDGTSAILTGQSTTSDEYYAVSAVTSANEGLRTMALTKGVGDYECYNAKTMSATSVDDGDITLNGWLNPHNATLTNAHFEYGPTMAYGSTSSDIPITVSGHTKQVVSSAISSPLSDRADVLHYRLVVNVDGTPVYGDDQEIRLTSGFEFSTDGADDYLNLSAHPDLPIYRNGAGTGYTIAFWIKAPQPTVEGQMVYYEGVSSVNWYPSLRLRTRSGSGGLWITIADDDTNYRLNAAYGVDLLDDTWHHFAWVDANGTANIYVDGEDAGYAISYTPGPMTLDTASLGARLRDSADNFFPGAFDEVSFWDKALSESEIQNLMHQGLQGNEANLKAYYRLDDGPTNRLIDPVTFREASIVGGGSKSFSTAPLGVAGTLVQTTASTSVGDAGKQLTVDITSGSPTVNYLGIYKTGHGGNRVTTETFPEAITQRWSIFWGIKEYGAVTADLVIDYSTVPGISNPGAIKLLKRANATSDWTDVTSEFTHNTTNRTFTKTGETSFSEFSIGDNGENPTAVELADFIATPDGAGIRLDWETASELTTVGFHLYRAESEVESPVRLTQDLLPCQWPGSLMGGSYTYQDLTVIPGMSYYYWLETLEIDGASTLFGPIQSIVESSGGFKIYLPLLMRDK